MIHARSGSAGDATAAECSKGFQAYWPRLWELSRRCFCLASHQSRTSFKIAGTTGMATAANINQSVFVMQSISGKEFQRHQNIIATVTGDDCRNEDQTVLIGGARTGRQLYIRCLRRNLGLAAVRREDRFPSTGCSPSAEQLTQS